MIFFQPNIIAELTNARTKHQKYVYYNVLCKRKGFEYFQNDPKIEKVIRCDQTIDLINRAKDVIPAKTIHCCGKNRTTDPNKTIKKNRVRNSYVRNCVQSAMQLTKVKTDDTKYHYSRQEIRRAHGFQIDIDFIDRFSLRSMSNVASRSKMRKKHLNMIFFPTLCENPNPTNQIPTG